MNEQHHYLTRAIMHIASLEGHTTISSNNVNIIPEKQIADEIISIENTCVKNEVEKVLISRIERINKLLKEKCEKAILFISKTTKYLQDIYGVMEFTLQKLVRLFLRIII